jgi:hypothetical protein
MSEFGLLNSEQHRVLAGGLNVRDISIFREHKMFEEIYFWEVRFGNEFNEKRIVSLRIREDDIDFSAMAGEAEQYVAGIVRRLIAADVVESRVEKWTFEEVGPDTLWEYIGMNEEQYGEFLENKNLPEDWSLPNG